MGGLKNMRATSSLCRTRSRNLPAHPSRRSEMAIGQKTKLHPETGATLLRGVRTVTLTFRSQKETIELPGWYPADDPTADQGIHDARDMQISDRAINLMKARETGL